MKKVLSLFSVIVISLMLSLNLHAEEEVQELQEVYDNAYEAATLMYETAVIDEYTAYGFLVNNPNVVTRINNQIVATETSLSEDELTVLTDFISKLNVLIELDAIVLNDDMRLLVKEAPTVINRPVTAAMTFDLMSEARSNSAHLKAIYDNAIFTQKHLVAGTYFAQRVKSGGIWDYKVYLGVHTVYYEPTLGVNMTGETIGNFNYGYVGRTCFDAGTLKAAAGLAQIMGGTSDFSYWNSYFDDPRDQADIQWGIDVYLSEH